MPMEVSWFVDKRIILIRHRGVITQDELIAAYAQTNRMIAEGDAPVHVIAHMLKMRRMPITVRALRTSLPEINDNIGWVINVTTHPLTKMFATIVNQLVGFKFRHVPTMDAAVQHLLHNDISLQVDTFIDEVSL
ncbi:MAG: hypothetical protein ACPG7F_06980 [Aggregatilineales bacterium]